MSSSSIFLSFSVFVVLFGFISAGDDEGGKTCVEKNKGICKLEGLYSFCYTNVKTGDFDCDDDKKCADKSETFKGKKEKGGCFGTGVCCCKATGPICNYLFLKNYNVSGTQACSRKQISEFGTTEPSNCTDHYCYAIRYTVPGKTGAYKVGCHSMLHYYFGGTER